MTREGQRRPRRMTERIEGPREVDAILADYDEMTGHGVAHIDAARRLNVDPDDLATWVTSRATQARRVAKATTG
jgi:hypothetical protein